MPHPTSGHLSTSTSTSTSSSVSDWELGLPSGDDLTPLSQSLLTPSLVSAFAIPPHPSLSSLHVDLASSSTIDTLRSLAPSSADLSSFQPFDDDDDDPDRAQIESKPQSENPAAPIDGSKRQRLVWTAQLHKRFVDVVERIGIKNAVPKTIMQMMNVEGLTRENVASHLQKYRLYVRRVRGHSRGEKGEDEELVEDENSVEKSGRVGGYVAVPLYGQFGMGQPGSRQQFFHGFGGLRVYGEAARDRAGGNQFGPFGCVPPNN